MKNEEMARLFSEATPYIQKYHGKTMVVKYVLWKLPPEVLFLYLNTSRWN